MRSSRRNFLIGAMALSAGTARAQSSKPLHVTGARPTIFYAPLIATVTQGFLKKHGVEADFHWLGSTPLVDGLRNATVDVIQSAVSNYWTLSDRGEATIPVHIAEINRRDGFFWCGVATAPLLTGSSWKEKPSSRNWADNPRICCAMRFPPTKWMFPR